ncbi:TadA family conjugal transfer-associated ATPase [Psychromicrobium sp. YIM B11713]|uniref:TadA family conjugal transfer-associated ATPase n=1 Tax=Psychromicrobium sp. YIM B11713 TaxID=3145233 RepID=UPI00374F6F1D
MRHRLAQHAPAIDEELLEEVRRKLVQEGQSASAAQIASAVRASGRILGTTGALRAVDRIRAELAGLGPLQFLLQEADTSDIFVNSPAEVWVRRGHQLLRAEVEFSGEAQVRGLAKRLVGAAGKRLDEVSPYADVQLSGGLRVHAVLPPISTTGTLLSIRVRRAKAFSLDELIACGTLSEQSAGLIEAMIFSGLNILISGATGSGKTSLLNALLALCPPEQRIVIVEDTTELAPQHPHILSLQGRGSNVEGRGAVPLQQLIYQALRMNPNRLIVGECRGAEVRELLTALNTGHSGGGTIHANSAADVPARLQALGALAEMTPQAVDIQAASAIDAVLHLENTGTGRRLTQLGILERASGRLEVQLAAECGAEGVRPGKAWAQLQRRLSQS